jgi:integrase
MGVTIRQKPPRSGIWWVFINHKGKRKSKKVGRDKKTADRVAEEIEKKIAERDFKLENSTFKDYADEWLGVTIPATCKYSTQVNYRSLMNGYILPAFKSVPVTDINRKQIKKFLMEKHSGGLASSTVGHMKSAIAGVLNLAVDDEVIPANPAHRLGKLFQSSKPKKEISPLDRKEISILLEAVKKLFPADYPLVLTMARTGMRFGEARGLKWGDIDFKGRFIMVRRGISRGRLETPKSGKSRRVDMSMQLAETLEKLKLDRKAETLLKGWKEIPEWVFISKVGSPVDEGHWRRRVFSVALEKAKLRKIRIHDLRHSFASLLIQAGESLAYIRDQLGHHSIKVTVDIYGHLVPGGNKAAVDRLDDENFCTLYAPTKKTDSRKTY